ncbi:hypothetical protein G3580_01750 [Nitrogeniibacter mangrovi]|uniref:Chorismatase FkbO/Hyg5-like N-terminal domain-containing protein n=1 Tax=Nitrogeniibacter mangrovi TaxID=2016596 RepID=A0A6C1AYL9_9RHOO|nr:hypothetical protein [Nitrogeniibacter mangrovi]QID16461.1 hypothetical protein G3580_01750 [Nitrogeniibacter mangrovi]
MTARVIHWLGAHDALPPGRNLLGGVAYGGGDAWGGPGPVLPVDVPVLDGEAAAASLWLTDAPVRTGDYGPVRFARTDELIFGVLRIDEANMGDTLEAATRDAYTALFQTLDACGYPTLMRAWNYLPHINREDGGVERYRRFNAGRQAAFSASRRPLAGKVPAACALGTGGGELSIAFLGSVNPFVPVENPRQVSAYHYPPEYGERSPTFSRAGLARIGGRDALLVSGTAAIVGHRSLHSGDVMAQADETLANLAAVVEAANAYPGARRHAMDALDYTVYVRHAADAPAVLARLRAAVGAGARVVCVQADVCRAELLVEIEAMGGLDAKETP